MILDTNAYSALLQGVPSAVQAISGEQELAIPIQVIAELRYGFAFGPQTAQNEATLQRFLAQDRVTILYPTLTTTEHYANMAAHCRRNGRALTHNDLWIAALTLEHQQPLLTYDQDFAALNPLLADNLFILSNT